LRGLVGVDDHHVGSRSVARARPLPTPEIFSKWLCEHFSRNTDQPILLIDGFGENWKEPKPTSVIATTCHAGINFVQLKTFQRILLLRQIACEYSVEPVIYIMALRDILRKLDHGQIKEKISETRRFLKEVFSAQGVPFNTIVDKTKIQKDTHSIFTVLDFNRSLESILEQMKTPEELEKTKVFGEKRTALTRMEKRLVSIYLFERRMMDEESKKYPYISWGLETQAELGVSYIIYDRSNAGAAVLRKLASIENGKEYPGTIVLPDPLIISGEPMRYKVQQRDLGANDALLLSDSYGQVKHKLVGQQNVSNEFLDYLIGSIILPFASNMAKKEADLLTNLKTQASFSTKQQLVLKHYWEFIRPYFDSIERITGLHEGLFVHDELVEEALTVLGSERNRIILQRMATYYRNKHDGLTAGELSQQMSLSKTEKRGLYRNLHQLEKCGLVMSIMEGDRLRKYFVRGNKTMLHIRWSLLETSENLARTQKHLS
jgi:hypothetical protein